MRPHSAVAGACKHRIHRLCKGNHRICGERTVQCRSTRALHQRTGQQCVASAPHHDGFGEVLANSTMSDHSIPNRQFASPHLAFLRQWGDG